MDNEKRLIDANALIKDANAEGAYGYVDAKQIADAPTVDAVEVVRCEKCKHAVWEEEIKMWRCVESAEYDEEMGGYLGVCEYHYGDFFCFYGKRKDGDGNAHLTDLKQAEKLYGCSKAAFDDCFGEEPDNA